MSNSEKINQNIFSNCLKFTAVLVVGISLFVGIEDHLRSKPWRTTCVGLDLGEEYVPDDEASDIEAVVATIDPFIKSRLNGTNDDPKPDGLAKRVQHPIGWQCIDGLLTVNADIEDDLRVGIFKEPGASFHTTIRTSHSNFDADNDPKTSAIALKVHVGGLGPRIDISDYPPRLQEMNLEKQDFVFVSADSISLGDRVLDFKSLHEYQMWGGIGGIFAYLTPRPTALFRTFSLLISGTGITIPFLTKHNTLTASRFGNNATAAKFVLKPCRDEKMPPSPPGAKFFVKDMSNAYVESNGVCMDMFVQMQVDSCKNPIETVSFAWDEDFAPLKKVAQLTVSKSIASQGNCEFMAFNPWYGLQEHMPLGYVSRLRRELYRESAFLRMKMSVSCPFFKYKKD